MLGRRHAEASSTASGYTLLINAESAEGNPALTKGSPAPRIGRIRTDLWDDVHWELIIIHKRALNFHERELRGSDVSARIFGKDFLSRKIIIRERALNFHERELRGSDVSARIFGKDFLSGMVIIRGRELKMHKENSADRTYLEELYFDNNARKNIREVLRRLVDFLV